MFGDSEDDEEEYGDAILPCLCWEIRDTVR
jgi:hypothetical protein